MEDNQKTPPVPKEQLSRLVGKEVRPTLWRQDANIWPVTVPFEQRETSSTMSTTPIPSNDYSSSYSSSSSTSTTTDFSPESPESWDDSDYIPLESSEDSFEYLEDKEEEYDEEPLLSPIFLLILQRIIFLMLVFGLSKLVTSSLDLWKDEL